jgi:hypothetical protein
MVTKSILRTFSFSVTKKTTNYKNSSRAAHNVIHRAETKKLHLTVRKLSYRNFHPTNTNTKTLR